MLLDVFIVLFNVIMMLIYVRLQDVTGFRQVICSFHLNTEAYITRNYILYIEGDRNIKRNNRLGSKTFLSYTYILLAHMTIINYLLQYFLVVAIILGQFVNKFVT